jgi:hypothetical protein
MMKQSADALVPGQVGMGMTPGVTGMLDSDPMTASNSAIAAQRAAMQEAALIHANADAGAGYSTPAPATSPSLQMAADVKAAAVVEEAIKFAEHIYLMNKEALTAEEREFAKNKMRENLAGPERSTQRPAMDPQVLAHRQAQFLKEQEKARVLDDMLTIRHSDNLVAPKEIVGQSADPTFFQKAKHYAGMPLAAAKGHYGRGWQAAAIGGAALGAGGAGYAGYQMMQPAAPDMEPKAAFQLPFSNYHLVHRPTVGQRLDRAADYLAAQAAKVNNPAAYAAMAATGAAGAGAGYMLAPQEKAAYDSAAAAVAYAYQMKAAAEGDPGMLARARQGMSDAYGWTKNKMQAGAGAYDAFAAAHPRAVPAGMLAAGAAGGFGAAHLMAHQAQLAQQAAAAEQGLAAPQNETMHYMKAAALNNAAQAGQFFALQQLGLA